MLPLHPDRLTNVDLDQWIRSLVDTEEPEGTLLDYKQELNISKPTDRRELAKDAASFANELGGTLIYGVPERRQMPQSAPIPTRPYGIDAILGLEQNLENIFSTTVSPLFPEFRIRQVELSEYPGKVCYLVWTPESWIGPHMVHGYNDGRFYRRGQFRAVIMSERDVEDRYRRRLATRVVAEEFRNSEAALHAHRLLGRSQAKTSLFIIPLLLVPNRVAFGQPSMRVWLAADTNTIGEPWSPTMYGVAAEYTEGTGRRTRAEIHRNGAVVVWQYTAVKDINGPPVMNYVNELSVLNELLTIAGNLYNEIKYTGPLSLFLTIHCPESYALHLPQRNKVIPLQPSGTSIQIRIEPSALDLVSRQRDVLRNLGDELFRAFGIWQADCFDAKGQLITPHGYMG